MRSNTSGCPASDPLFVASQTTPYPHHPRGEPTPRALGHQLPLPPPPHPPRGLRPTASCPRCRPQESMGAEGARRSMGTKGAQRKCLSTLHPNTILNPNPLTPTPTLSLVLTWPAWPNQLAAKVRVGFRVMVWLEGGQGEVRGARDGPTLGLGGMYPPPPPPQIAPPGPPSPPTDPPGPPPQKARPSPKALCQTAPHSRPTNTVPTPVPNTSPTRPGGYSILRKCCLEFEWVHALVPTPRETGAGRLGPTTTTRAHH